MRHGAQVLQEAEVVQGRGWRSWRNPNGWTVEFPGCWVHTDEAGKYLHTAFPDGRTLHSVIDPEKDAETARAYGYGEDIERLWREHDLLHHWTALQFDLPHSPTIWSECHPEAPQALARWHRLDEERFVGYVHRWLNLAEWRDDIWAFHERGHDLELLLDDARALFATVAL
jgi:hypothetical protein